MFPLKDNIPTDRFPVVTVALIVANVLMYLFFQKALGSSFLNSPDYLSIAKDRDAGADVTSWIVKAF